ncbi:hypothetical protein AAHH78_37095, partial [Burkholderia pseudomallei]
SEMSIRHRFKTPPAAVADGGRFMDVMAKLLTDIEFQRFSELKQKQASFTITPEEADELPDIVARAQKKRDDRASAMRAIEA